MAGFIPAIHVFTTLNEGPKTWMPGPLSGPGMKSNYSSPIAKSIYFFAGAILLSAGLAGSGLVSVLAVSAVLSMRSILAASRSLPT
jgi:hypothetical protein